MAATPETTQLQTPNSRTVASVHAERNRLLREVTGLHSAAKEMLDVESVLSEFKAASLGRSSEPFSFKDLPLKDRYGITAEDLKLTKENIDALPVGTLEQANKKKALELQFALNALSAEISAKQKAGLWQQHILFGSLLDDPKGIGFGGVGCSLDDLNHLNNSTTKALTVLDASNFKGKVELAFEKGKLVFKLGVDANPAEIRDFIDKLATAGNKIVTIGCRDSYTSRESKDLPRYEAMLQGMFERIVLGGYDIKMNVIPPSFVTNPGLTRTLPNGEVEPQDSRERQAFHSGKKLSYFWHDVANKTPRGIAIGADKSARLAAIYAGVMKQHKQPFLRMLHKNPELQAEMKGMVAYFIRAGQMDQFIAFQNDVSQVLGKDASRVIGSTVIERVVKDEMLSMSLTELNQALDNFFDYTQASRHYEGLTVTFDKGSSPKLVIEKMVGEMTSDQIKGYAKHLADNPGISQLNERVGMLLTNGSETQRQTFVEAYLAEVQQKACERHGIVPGVINQIPVKPATTPPTTTPEPLAERQERYKKIQAEVTAAADGLLTGTQSYAKRMSSPNVDPLTHTHAQTLETLKRLATDRIKDVAVLYPVAAIDEAAQDDYVKQALKDYTEGSAAKFVANSETFANTVVAPHVRAPS